MSRFGAAEFIVLPQEKPWPDFGPPIQVALFYLLQTLQGGFDHLFRSESKPG